MSKLAAALAWARRGFRVFPLYPDDPSHPNNDKLAKEPVWKGWTDFATTDAAMITAWWQGVEYNVGVLTDGYLGVDIDTKQGRAGMQSWAELHGGFDTLVVRTPSGGYHLYYSGANVANNQSVLGPGIDVRSYHGYLVAPGSTVNGRAYTVEIDAPLQPAPPELVARCAAAGVRAENAALMLVESDKPAAIALAVAKVAATPGAVSGELSEASYRLACAVRDFGISEPMAGALMDLWAQRCTPPISPDDLRGRIANAYAYAQNPGGGKNPEVMFGAIVLPELPVEALPPPPSEGISFGNLLPLAELKPRPWVLKRLLLRDEVTAILAPGGVGKSSLQLFVALHLALGAPCLGFDNNLGQPAKSIIYNAEDSLEEMSMRLYAMCQCLGVEPSRVAPMIALRSGKNHGKLRLVAAGNPNPVLNKDAVQELILAASDPEVAMIGLDPANKLHTVNGNDNIAMGFFMEAIELIAAYSHTAVMLGHHTSKPSGLVRMAGNADSSQGASAVVNSCRVAMTLSDASDEDAVRFGLTPNERRYYLRMDDAKMNRGVKNDEPVWIKRVGVRLYNGEEVGAFEKADMHQRTEHMRQMVGSTLKTIMVHSHGTAGLKLADAVKALKGYDGLFDKMRNEQIKQRIEAALFDPLVLADGSTLHMEGGVVVLG